VLLAPGLRPWDYEAHRMVNQLALASLPADFPAFVRTPAAAERIAFLAGEPDRWRNLPDLPLRHLNNPDHYLDLEQLGWAGLDPASVSPLRYEFAMQFAAGRAAHPDKFPTIDPAKKQRPHPRVAGLFCRGRSRRATTAEVGVFLSACLRDGRRHRGRGGQRAGQHRST